MAKQVAYTSKRWLGKSQPIGELIRNLGYRLVGEINEDNYIVQRRGDHRPIFHLLHISWGDKDAVEKYKLFRINVFELGGADKIVEMLEKGV